jgi:hypothetical protein
MAPPSWRGFKSLYWEFKFIMAISFSKVSGNFKLVSSKDPSVRCDEETYDKYLQSLDESLLNLEGEPTRFVIKRTLDYRSHKAVKGSQLERDGKEMKATTAFIMEQVRQSLVDIENPEGTQTDLVFKRASDGKASEELVADLESLGIVMEIYTAQGELKDTMVGVKKS